MTCWFPVPQPGRVNLQQYNSTLAFQLLRNTRSPSRSVLHVLSCQKKLWYATLLGEPVGEEFTGLKHTIAASHSSDEVGDVGCVAQSSRSWDTKRTQM